MDKPTVTYAHRPDATPEAEMSALAACYRLILNSAMKKAAPASGPDAAERSKDDYSARTIIPDE